MIYYSGFRWCLHKDHEQEEWDITRVMDVFRVYLTYCGGIRTEERT